MIKNLKVCALNLTIGVYLGVGLIGWYYIFTLARANHYEWNAQDLKLWGISFFVMSLIVAVITGFNGESKPFRKFMIRWLLIVPFTIIVLLGVLSTIIYYKTEGTAALETGLWITLIAPGVFCFVVWILSEYDEYKRYKKEHASFVE
ncbi:hypothetical protein [Bacillus gaemokensis]|uniref:Uncharacterized protein n=1 Tax=Bacillus gaemokensis TaxID=574375 RepID=A0A073K4C0_9BACI|nr:hypothetical protein [Bacillus gaemokensis]KEK22144.1 hypothetical protein BAGA_20930 [Bacillus gaemokensis]KYG35581.1 hypothetical protein AZF08_26255 [Bacillus gaemokensis]